MEKTRLTKRDCFSKTLTVRVNEFLNENEISKNGNLKLYLKVPALFCVFLLPYFLMLFGVIDNPWIMWLMTVIMGVGMSGIGFSVMHNANHGAFSTSKRVNSFMSYSLEILGGSSVNWRIQHNILHHCYTNIHDIDEDICPPDILRFSPNEPKKKIHGGQIFYAWFLYGMMTLSWVFIKDFRRLRRYHKKGLLNSQNITYRNALGKLAISKVLYFTYMAVIPLLILNITWWQWAIGFFTMHFVSGFIMALVFQMAHVLPQTMFLTKDNYKDENEEESWAKHQLDTTANFARKSNLLAWYIGGLNFQIEHHLFPEISHVHYPNLAIIVKETALEYNIQYHEFKTFGNAIHAHYKMLKWLGKE